MTKSERGITLIELLAAITILSFIGIIIWNAFFQGYQFSKKAISKNFMIQESNIVITNLTRIHQKSKQYTITNTDSNCEITISYIDKNGANQTEVYNNPQICLTFEMKNGVTNPVVPTTTNNVTLKLTASDKKNNSNKVLIDTILYRYKGGN